MRVATTSTAIAPSGSRVRRPARVAAAATAAPPARTRATDEPAGPDDAVPTDVGDRGDEDREQRHSGADRAPGAGEGVEAPVVEHGQPGGEDGGGAEEHHHRETARLVPQGLGEPPRDAARDTHEEGQVGPRQIAVHEGGRRPEAEESGLERGDLQRLRGLEEHRPDAQRGEQSRGSHERGRGSAAGEDLAPDEEGEPDEADGREAGRRGRAGRGWQRPARSGRCPRSRRRGRAARVRC